MSDLDFKHNVSEVPAGASLPKPYQREVKAEVTGTPDFQNPINRYAEDTNWLSKLGSNVAVRSSNAIAAKLGGELGKNPQGEIGPSFTEFDENFQKSYATQAQSTLGLQAQKLITQANLELAAAPRIDAGSIEKSQKQVMFGLQKIFSLAPDSVRSSMEGQYGSLMIQQNEHLMTRMRNEQKEDRINTLDLASKVNNQNVSSFAISGVGLDKDGNSKPAMETLKTIEQAWSAAVANHDKTPLEAKTAIDSAKIAMLSGKYGRLAMIADKNGTRAQFEKDLANNPPKDIPNQYHDAVYSSVMQTLQVQQSLRNDAENIASQQMHNRIATDPTTISDSDWTTFEGQVSKLKSEQMRFNLIQALKSKKDENEGVDNLLAHYGDAVAQANAGPKVQNAAFNKNVQNLRQKDASLTQDEAEVQVAMSAGATVPVFTDSLKNKLWNGDPAQMDSGMRQFNELQNLHSGHALKGLNDQDRALVALYEAQRNPADPTVGARLAIEVSQNLDPTILKVTNAKWDTLVDNNTRLAKTDVDEWILNKFFTQSRSVFHPLTTTRQFDSPFMSTLYAGDILNKYKTFYQLTRGNENIATKMTNEYVESSYDQTSINGSKQWAKYPMEKTIGFAAGDGIPAIHKDIIRQLSKPLANLKQSYDNNVVNEYYEIQPPKSEGEPIKIIEHSREGNTTNTKSFDMVLVGNSFDSWDVNMQTANGPENLFLHAPQLGVTTYTPDRPWIKDEYMGLSHTFPNEKYSAVLKPLLTPSDGGGQ